MSQLFVSSKESCLNQPKRQSCSILFRVVFCPFLIRSGDEHQSRFSFIESINTCANLQFHNEQSWNQLQGHLQFPHPSNWSCTISPRSAHEGGLISNRRDGRNKRYFESKKFSSTEMKVISVLRHQKAGKILTILHDEESASRRKLAQRLNISSQALTWNMKQLKESGLVTSLVDGSTIKYFVDEVHFATVKRCINVIANGKIKKEGNLRFFVFATLVAFFG